MKSFITYANLPLEFPSYHQRRDDKRADSVGPLAQVDELPLKRRSPFHVTVTVFKER